MVAAGGAGRATDVVVVVGASVVDVAGSEVDVVDAEGDVVVDGCGRGGAAFSSSGSAQADTKRAVNAITTDVAFLCINSVLRSDPGSG